MYLFYVVYEGGFFYKEFVVVDILEGCSVFIWGVFRVVFGNMFLEVFWEVKVFFVLIVFLSVFYFLVFYFGIGLGIVFVFFVNLYVFM